MLNKGAMADLKFQIVIYCTLAVISVASARQTECFYYDYRTCTEGNSTESTCNKTRVCEPFGNKPTYCFSSWKNESGQISFLKRGCWSEKICSPTSECVGEKHLEVYFCCCTGDLCNGNISNITYVRPQPPATPPLSIYTGRPKSSDRHLEKVLLYYVLIPVFGLLVTISVLLYMWRKHKRNILGRPLLVSAETPPPSPPMNGKPISLIEMVAQGQFGCVWKAKSAHEIVAVKVFSQQERASWVTEKEAYFKYDLKHESILQYIGAEKRGQGLSMDFWIITEYHEHGSLADYLKRHLLSWEQLLGLVLSMVNGMVYLHSDMSNNIPPKPAMAHRDFKSRNVLVKNNLTCCIGDFGLAVAFEGNQSPGEARAQVGTKRYMAPEVLEGAITFQRESFLHIDMYALALVLWETVSRCTVIEGFLEDYRLPFEDDVGVHPSIEDMQDVVVEKKVRPHINELWRKHQGISVICETIEDCWDQDADARLSAHCVYERLSQLSEPGRTVSALTSIMNTSSGDEIKSSSGVSSCSLSDGRESLC